MQKRIVRDNKGFTMVELMIVVIIVGILTAVGVPLYLNYVQDAKVASAKTLVSSIVTAEKLYFQKTGTFVNVTDALFEGDPTLNPINVDVRDATQFWTVSVSGATVDGFTVNIDGKDAGDEGDYTDIAGVTYTYNRGAADVWAGLP